jgi:hypothetical protein
MTIKKREYNLAAKAAQLVDEVVDIMLELDNIGEDIFAEWGDVGVMNARQEVKIAIYREGRRILEEWRTNPLCENQEMCGGGACEFCRKAIR